MVVVVDALVEIWNMVIVFSDSFVAAINVNWKAKTSWRSSQHRDHAIDGDHHDNDVVALVEERRATIIAILRFNIVVLIVILRHTVIFLSFSSALDRSIGPSVRLSGWAVQWTDIRVNQQWLPYFVLWMKSLFVRSRFSWKIETFVRI